MRAAFAVAADFWARALLSGPGLPKRLLWTLLGASEACDADLIRFDSSRAESSTEEFFFRRHASFGLSGTQQPSRSSPEGSKSPRTLLSKETVF